MPQKRIECFRLLFGPSCMNRASVLAWYKRFKEGRESLGMMRGGRGVRKSIDQSWLATQLGLVLLCWGFKEFRRDSLGRSPALFISALLAFPSGQCTSPQLHPCHRLFDQDGQQDISSPSLSSKPCSLWRLVIPKAQRLSLWDNWGDERGYDKGHWHAHARGLLWSLQKLFERYKCIAAGDITSKGTRDSYTYYQ